ncbi:MAG: hypothetical protein H0W40_02395 [Methylibium sp.]|uniref:hypothetical protein n=1 Tax=Methylibium sp. TaxID=2067992 RepID=UPI0017CF202B|nr:hypothetical protein [Methylibium sp.]MBA3596214.1 hypothetical protein [Methylibium sp.]
MPLEEKAVVVMTGAFRRMEGSVTSPQRVAHKGSFVWRYANRGIHEAIVQKLARNVSGLNAVFVLLQAGYVQEVGVLLRTLDEIQEDIMFLAIAETNGARSERHERYLKAFYSDLVFSRHEGSLEIQKPDLVPRKKIRAHTMNVLGKGVKASQALVAGEAVGTAYSGYVHANSECIMDMYGGENLSFHVEGMMGTPRIAACARGAENYIYRGLTATIAAAKAFGDAQHVEVLYRFLAEYEAANGHPSPKVQSSV